MENIDAVVVGAGAVGISTAYHLAQEGVDVLVVEKESGPAMHQSGRNSGVIHSGYNLKPGSVKAEYCVQGNRELREYCEDRGVPIREGGILVIARDDNELDVVNQLNVRGIANGAEVHLLSEDEIQDVEPHARGIGALLASDGASFDSRGYVHALASDANAAGTRLFYNREVKSIKETDQGVVVDTHKGKIAARVAINAAGLYADILAGGIAEDVRVIPFRGYYAELKPGRTDLVNSHVYAAPDLNFPFLGVHLSKRTDGRVIVGPGAMLAFGREAYDFSSFKGGMLGKTLTWPGFYKMMKTPEFQNLMRREVKKSLAIEFIGREAMELIPELRRGDLVRSFAGNRAQLVDKEGKLVDDIMVRQTPHSLHVLNAVSPGLTCSLPFGRRLAQQAISKL